MNPQVFDSGLKWCIWGGVVSVVVSGSFAVFEKGWSVGAIGLVFFFSIPLILVLFVVGRSIARRIELYEDRIVVFSCSAQTVVCEIPMKDVRSIFARRNTNSWWIVIDRWGQSEHVVSYWSIARPRAFIKAANAAHQNYQNAMNADLNPPPTKKL